VRWAFVLLAAFPSTSVRSAAPVGDEPWDFLPRDGRLKERLDVLELHGGATRRRAASIYDGRRFADLSVLADLLEEAGLTDAALLGHLRGPGPHGLGCWALDAVIGKS
jgi:hypothetical protein